MGKWTPLHTENVMTEKLRTIIKSAIQDLKEKDPEPVAPPTYESFVESLDTDSLFVKKVMQLLVLESADSRFRSKDPNAVYLSTRTRDALATLLDESHLYRSQYQTSTRPRVTARGRTLIPPLRMEPHPPVGDREMPGDSGWEDLADEPDLPELDDDDMDHYLDVERSAATLDNLYNPNSLPTPAFAMPHIRRPLGSFDDGLPSPIRDEQGRLSFSSRHFRMRSEGSGSVTGSSTTLARQPSIRQPHPPTPMRMRTFSDYTNRVRANARSRLEAQSPRQTLADDEGPLPRTFSSSYVLPPLRDPLSDNDETQNASGHASLRELAVLNRRSSLAGRLRRGGVPAPELVRNGSSAPLTVGSGVTVPSRGMTLLEGQAYVLHRSPSPLITLFEGNQGTGADASSTAATASSRREATHLATPRSSTPGSLDGAGGPTGATEIA